MEGPDADLQGHLAPLEGNQKEGWGRVSIPADVNPADNEYFFVFAEPPPRKTIVVADDDSATRPIELAAAISPESPTLGEVEATTPDKAASIAWEEVALVVWQAPLPQDADAQALRAVVERGGQTVFLPPRNLTSGEFYGVSWG